jgi:hypothetical protein
MIKQTWVDFRQPNGVPPEGGVFIVYLGKTKNGDTWGGDPYDIARFTNGNWMSLNQGAPIDVHVTHWCNLPEKP